VPGPGDFVEPATLREVRAPLAHEQGALVGYIVMAGEMHALVVHGSRGRVLDLGPVEPVLERMRTVRADLDTLALNGMPASLRATVMRSLDRGLTALGDLLWTPLGSVARTGPVVLVPAGALTAVPWTQVPALRGRPLTLARSATAWLRNRQRARRDPSRGVLLAAGPDLTHAETEVESIAALWGSGPALSGGAATGQAVLDGLATASMAHIAAHGVHEAANPLFSAIRLADGPLFGYDLDRATALPDHVVLSACDLGLVTERPGDEVLGMTAALLHAGVASVVASVARVSDEVSAEVLVNYHRGLRAGQTPAEALAAATADRTDAPFVCYGAGW
jgi:hypothetical protein